MGLFRDALVDRFGYRIEPIGQTGRSNDPPTSRF